MKDAKIYTGTGWQSLKGPPGPSAVSADAGNLLDIGSDGLVRFLGYEEFSTFFLTNDAQVLTPTAGTACYFTVGRMTTLVMAVLIDKQELAEQGALTGPVRMGLPYVEWFGWGGATAEGTALATSDIMTLFWDDECLFLTKPNTVTFAQPGNFPGAIQWSELKDGWLRISVTVLANP